MKYAVLFVLFFGFGKLSAQVSTIDTTYEARFQKLKVLYLEMLDSESYQKFDSVCYVYTQKIYFRKNREDIRRFDSMNDWVKVNLDKTDYLTFSEAEDDYNKIKEYSNEMDIENKEYEEYLFFILGTKGGSKMFSDMLYEVVSEDPQRFKQSNPRDMLKFKPRN